MEGERWGNGPLDCATGCANQCAKVCQGVPPWHTTLIVKVKWLSRNPLGASGYRRQPTTGSPSPALEEREKSRAAVSRGARIPSLWYIPLVGGENLFYGFSFAAYRKRFGWHEDIPIDRH